MKITDIILSILVVMSISLSFYSILFISKKKFLCDSQHTQPYDTIAKYEKKLRQVTKNLDATNCVDKTGDEK